MEEFFEETFYHAYLYITHYNFPIQIQGDCTDYHSFEYVVWWEEIGMLFIGRDQLGYLPRGTDEIDDMYNHNVIVTTYELIPKE